MYMYAGILLLLLVRSNISLISILCNTVFIKSNLHEFQIHYDQNDLYIYNVYIGNIKTVSYRKLYMKA